MSKTALWTPDFLARHLQQADPLADEAMARIVEQQGPSEAQRLFGLLIRNIEMPVSHHQFLIVVHGASVARKGAL